MQGLVSPEARPAQSDGLSKGRGRRGDARQAGLARCRGHCGFLTRHCDRSREHITRERSLIFWHSSGARCESVSFAGTRAKGTPAAFSSWIRRPRGTRAISSETTVESFLFLVFVDPYGSAAMLAVPDLCLRFHDPCGAGSSYL